ncbi:hypothetical protein AVEN_225466-1 [Araneus ventricosus]|uniref:Uncharacterized protein n=1 Tax=Araneus ventricosus TaxID=182803 RepID=A0A4Y2RWG8_ARAVE|nr:hypothetical protein AVEN_225466-1 [Araneus ventricosus]
MKVRRDIVTYNLEIGWLNCAKTDLTHMMGNYERDLSVEAICGVLRCSQRAVRSDLLLYCRLSCEHPEPECPKCFPLDSSRHSEMAINLMSPISPQTARSTEDELRRFREPG